MRISLNWLTDYVDVAAIPVKELAVTLTDIGLNCEEIIETATDIVLDLEVTSNRSDCLGHLGVARETAAVTGKVFTPPSLEGVAEGPVNVADLVEIVVEAPDLCPRYTARVIQGVTIGPSPGWLVERLEAAGLRSINNVVDVTNYVLMEYSQPLHSFDYDKLEGRKIIVRRALGGETMVSIDETTCKLDENMLVIADAKHPVAIAGVMGGLASEVTAATTNVLIEAAQFDPLATRRTSRTLGLMSESNYRFERGVDPVALDAASLRACQMIMDLAGGELASGMVDVWAKPFEAQTVTIRPARCSALLGLDIPAERQVEILDRLGLAPRVEGEQIACTIPAYRADLTREADLIEEVARVEGFNSIPTSPHVTHSVTDEGLAQRTRCKAGLLMTAGGFDEAITYSFCDAAEAELFGFDRAVNVDANVRKSNNTLRPTLWGSLLRACKTNQDAGNTSVSLFELAAVFPAGPGALPDERVELAMVTTRDLRDLRGVVEMLLARLVPSARLDVRPADVGGLGEGVAAGVFLNDQSIGDIGMVADTVQSYYGLEHPVCAARLDFRAVTSDAQKRRTFSPLAKFPSVSRDLSLVVDEATTWRDVRDTIASVDQPMRVDVEYVTTFRGKQIAPGRKSVTVRLVYRSEGGTLRSEDVDSQVADVVSALKKKISATLRT